MSRNLQLSVVLYLQESIESTPEEQVAAVRQAGAPGLPLLWACREMDVLEACKDEAALQFLRDRAAQYGDAQLRVEDEWGGAAVQREGNAAGSATAERSSQLYPAGRMFDRLVTAAEAVSPSPNSTSLRDPEATLSPGATVEERRAFAGKLLRRAFRRLRKLAKASGSAGPLYVVIDLAVPELRDSIGQICSNSLLKKRWSGELERTPTVVRDAPPSRSPISRARRTEPNAPGKTSTGTEREYLSNMNGEALLPAEGYDVLFSTGHFRGFAAAGAAAKRIGPESAGRIRLYGPDTRATTVHALPQGAFSFEEQLTRGISGYFLYQSDRFSEDGVLRTDYYTNDRSDWIIFDATLTYPVPSQRLCGDLEPLRLLLFRSPEEREFQAEAAGADLAFTPAATQSAISGDYFRFTGHAGNAVSVIALTPGRETGCEVATSCSRNRKHVSRYLLPFGTHRRLSSVYWAGVTEHIILAMTPRAVEPEELRTAATELRQL